MIGRRTPNSLRLRAGLALLLLSTAAAAAPGFITGSQVSGGLYMARIDIDFACIVEYVDHLPPKEGERLRISLRTTGVCNGVPPTIVDTRQMIRPTNAGEANLVDIAYEGDSPGGPTLTLTFSKAVHYSIVQDGASTRLAVNVMVMAAAEAPPAERQGARPAVRVRQPAEETTAYVINLSSSRRPHAAAEIPGIELPEGTAIVETEVDLAGVTWYRLRLGTFSSSDAAETAASKLRGQFPNAWIARDVRPAASTDADTVTNAATASPYAAVNTARGPVDLAEVDQLMGDARRAIIGGEYSRAVQLYTKVLQIPNHDRHPEALELLALAREKNGQTAHARAEYQRYLLMYPDSEGAGRVNQRLAALLAVDRVAGAANGSSQAAGAQLRKSGDWRIQTFVSQNYRRDVNQQNSEAQIISQSALYSDVNIDARRRGQRFDFSSRLSAGYRNDFLDEEQGSGNSVRVSYAYADLADAVTGLRGRLGRQSRNTGGVLGRFDGLNLGYKIGERLLVNTVFGKPVYSATDGADESRSFYGVSLNYGPILKNLDLGLFYIEQEIEGITDRQAVGGEFRYFGENQSIWGMIDYDVGYQELSSAFLQANWRFKSRLSIHALADRRGSPFLSAGNAMIGQPVTGFDELVQIFSPDEIRDLGYDRTSTATTYTIGLSYPLSPKLQISADATQSTTTATPASGGVLETPGSTYDYYSTSLIASSLFKEGDVSILGLRYSETETAEVISMTMDSRFPIGRKWRINPRLRVDLRRNTDTTTDDWIFSPGLRLYYRPSRKLRIEFEAGKQYAQLETTDASLENLDRESYFINFGYQFFF